MTAYSQFSDWSYTTAAAIYVLAMVFVLVEQAFGRVAKQRVAQRDQAKQRALVGAGASVPESGPPAEPPVSRPSAGRPERFGRMGVSLIVLGGLLHLAALVLRGVAAGRAPWGNMYGSLMAASFRAVVARPVVLGRVPVAHPSGFVPRAVGVVVVGGGVGHPEGGPVGAGLESVLAGNHVAAGIIGSGMFLVPGV